MWRKGYHHSLNSSSRNSGDYMFDSDGFDYESDIQEAETNIENGNDRNKSPHTGKKSKGFFRTLSGLTHGELSPKKKSSIQRARDVAIDQGPTIHTKSFIDTVRESPKLRTTSLERTNSMHSVRSSSSLSISRTHSNTLSKLGLSAKASRSESPFDDSDDDWNDKIEESAGFVDNEGYINYQINDGVSANKLSEKLKDLSIVGKTNDEQVDENYPFLKKNYEDIMKDPFSILTSQTPPIDDLIKYNKIVKQLTKSTVELTDLKTQTWGGIPSSLRALVWPILVGYISTNKSTRNDVLNRKRKEYVNSITRLFRSEKDEVVWHQIKIDVLRTNPTIKLYSYDTTHRSLEKILYLWAIRHPASGYVQGINDLVTPFFNVFLSQYLLSNIDIDNFDPQGLPKELLNAIEADTYWCFTKVLDTIQDNFIHQQPGIIRQITELKNLIKRDEPTLNQHFENENLDFIQFAFRWMNCMLMREFRLDLIIRMWDTYLSDFPVGFSQFHVYVCCAFLRRFSDYLMDMEFQDIIMFLQDPSKTEDWTEEDIELMLSEAFVWQSLYENASAHLK
ncbi:hypothetical protein CANINC_002868 [Pichia inconspicua]|uniref:Rab-GAP TBC domain-containing protein n=1 Tax=Pichia inconspicua TaxID=52247 RepID=A0A4T0X099_9ASCO|nr:hypothetical protein CANINC_002868 [[Candida] inconspicua]